MKLTVAILLLAAACHAAEQTYRGKQKTRDVVNTEKRELEEGNGNVDKRAPALSTVAPSPTPGIEYADSKESQQDNSPAQQVYATPVPQIAKISDVLTGQGPPFPAAIASHLYSPISVYQPRLGQPTTYEISPPVASQLAYSEHKISYQPQQNGLPVGPPAPPLKEVISRLPNYQPAYQQPIFVQPPPQAYQQIPQHQPLLQQIPQIFPQNYQQPIQVLRPVQYFQGGPLPHPAPAPVLYYRNQFQLPYLQAPQPLIPVPVQIPQVQPGVVYAQEGHHGQQNLQIVQKPQQIVQQQERPQEQQNVGKEQEPQQQQQQQKPSVQLQTYSQPQGAVSYASFSQSQPAPTFQSKQQPQQGYLPVQYQQQQQQQQQPRFTLQFRSQPLNTQVKPEGPENLVAASSKAPRPISYFRPGASFQLQPVQTQVLPPQQLLVPNPGNAPALAASPTFAPIQYFGKHAHSIFGAKYGPQS